MPQVQGSIGVPHRGVLTDAVELPGEGAGYKWLRGPDRHDDRHYAIPRLATAIEKAAARVANERPGGTLVVADMSVKTGGPLSPHISHRSGRDADLLLYMTTLEGAPVENPGFLHVGSDGLAWDPAGKRYLRFDVERQWLLVKALVSDPDARMQWIFAGHDVEAMLLEWARSRGETPETVARAMDVMLQPRPGGPHDDHVHIRTACLPSEIGCEHTGPRRPWLVALEATDAHGERATSVAAVDELLEAIGRPLSPTDAELAANARPSP